MSINNIRAAFAAITAVVILLSTTLFVLALSPLALVQRIGWQNPVPFLCGWGFHLLRLVVLEGLLGVKIRHRNGTGEYTPHRPREHEVTILIANHPVLPVLFSTPSLVWDLGWRGYASVVKEEFVKRWYLAWLGIPATLAGFALPIKRENPAQAINEIAAGVRGLPFGRRPFGVIIFPDGTRPTPDKIRQSWEKYMKISGNPLHLTPFTHVLVPKARGLHKLFTELEKGGGRHVRVVDLTIGFDRELPAGFWQCLVALCDATLTVNRADITHRVRKTTEDMLAEILLQRWAEKDRRLKEWVQSNAP